jgi:hypothetical protein
MVKVAPPTSSRPDGSIAPTFTGSKPAVRDQPLDFVASTVVGRLEEDRRLR